MPANANKKDKAIMNKVAQGKVEEPEKRRREKVAKDSTKQEIINQLMQSNLALQDKTIDLLHGIKDLTKKIDEMVSIFEEAAKQIKSGSDEPLMKKLEDLLDQNKTIAKGLILLEKYVRERASTSSFERPLPPKSF